MQKGKLRRIGSMISIIVPVYNIIEYLPQCLESLIGQTFSDIEIILVDDGSTDGCWDVCEAYKRRDSRIIVIHKENGGLVSARKAGLKAAAGEYIAYVDGDDWIEPDMYRRMYGKLVEHQADVVMCGRYEDTGSSSKRVFHGILEGKYGKQELLQRVYPKMIADDAFFEWCVFPGLWDKLFRRECVERFQFAVDERIVMGEDAACVYPCLLNADSIYVLHECLYHYRQTASSMVKKALDYETERKNFKILYQSVNESFKNDIHIFDLRRQWKTYMLFLMIPRADTLLEGIESLDYLFPFPQVKKGSNIILYGMGTYGQKLYKYIKRTRFCNIVMAADRNYVELQKLGIPAEAPENIAKCKYDAIVIANMFAKARNAIYSDLIQKYPSEKVHVIDEILIQSNEIQEKFGIV